MDLIYMGSIERQDHLSKLGAWGLWKRVEVEGTGRGEQRKMYSSIKMIKKRLAIGTFTN